MSLSTIKIALIFTLIAFSMTADSIERLYPPNVPAAIGPYTPVTVANGFVYVSGQIAINPKTGNIQADDILGQTYQVMFNLKAALEGAGVTFSDVIKTTVLLTDMSYFNTFNSIYAQFFEKNKFPARACYAVKQLPKAAALIEIQAVAVRSQRNKEQ